MASSYLKGITIQINGETTGLNRALKSVDSTIRQTSTQLNQVNKLLKLDPSSVDLTSTRTKLLNDAINATSERLNALYRAKQRIDSEGGAKTEEEQRAYAQLVIEIAKTENKYKDLLNTNKDVADSMKDVADETKQVSNEMDNASKSSSTFGDTFKAILASKAVEMGLQTVANAFKAIGSAITDTIKNGVSYNAEMESYQASFKAMTGSAEEATKALEAIKDVSKGSPFDLQSMIKANQMLLTTGESADDAREVINALGDAVAYTGGGNDELTRMSANLQQIKNVGKASSVDIKQFAMAGIDIYGILASSMGKSIDQIKEMDISYEDLSQALIQASSEGGIYFGAMEAQSMTLNGQMTQLKSNWNEFSGTIAQSSSALASQFLPVVNDTITAMTEGFQTNGVDGMVEALTNGINQMIEIVVEQLPHFVEEGVNILKGLIEGLLQNKENIVETIKNIIDLLMNGIIDLLPDILDLGIDIIFAIVDGLVGALPTLISRAPEIIWAVVDGAKTAFGDVVQIGGDIITGVWEGISGMAGWLRDKVAGWASDLIGSVKGFFGIHSPSTLFRDEIGVNMAKGISVGFAKEMPDVLRDVNGAMSGLNAGIQSSVNPIINPTANNNPLIIQIDNFNNERGSDIQALAEELEFYRRNSALAVGGVY